uniref:Uncharacterized protein n=1 Tax=Panagrolaimus sp. ES5 TaxID=591445 RepID=A0AC34G822_9BILA
MLTGIPLFPGINDAKDQLEKIFAIRGLPIVEKWPEVISLPNYKLFHFQPYVEMPWRRVHHVFSRLPEGGEKLLNSFLQVIFTVIF